ncbi:MAG: penicillin-resistant DD-carboxypeptidase [Herbinix sp.]|jgi:peptidoglycan hydrolase-like protein with peptidoglycan-binding domain/murein DD-endopeptidase MepM/ murein hydrolase activator NlpD|nr:penicillin-resistant DD-carboxypeptidase [Herbinix sp.]
MTGKIYDKTLTGTSGYAIFFDNVRVDQFVTNWSTQGAVDGGIGSASVEMIYLPDLYRLHSTNKNIKVGSQTIQDTSEVGDGLENMTNLRIFVKNMFTEKYCSVFDGNIKSKTLSKSGGEKHITFSASDYLTWFNKTIVPLAIPGESRLNFPDRMRWKAQGINLEEIPFVTQWRDIHFRGKNIEEMWKEVVDRTMSANMLYAQSEAAAWDNPVGRVVHMADIDPKYTKDQSALDFIVTASATMMNSIYTMMNDLIKSVLLEFFQDRDGQIRIKAPFWSEPILKSNVIDPALIINFTESTNWDAEYSRVIATGGLEWYEENMSESTKSYITPTAVYRTDGTFSTSASGSAGGGVGYSTPSDLTGANTGTWLDRYTVSSGYGPRMLRGANDIHKGIDWAMSTGTKVYHIGAKGTVTRGDQGDEGFGRYVGIEIIEGPYAGYTVIYAHLSNWAVTAGQTVEEGALLGYSGNTGNSTGPHLHVGVRDGGKGYIDPIYYLTETSSPKSLGNYQISIGDDSLLVPTEYEKKFGPAIFNVDQPMIKFSTASTTTTNRQSMYDMLKNYAKFMLSYLNSTVNIATLQTIAMPWLRVGFNIWVDPLGINRIYYLSSISFQGSASGGVYTNLGLTMGRTLSDFIDGKSEIGTLKPGESGNLFVNQMHDGYKVTDGNFGPIVGKKASNYTDFETKVLKFHMGVDTTEVTGLINSASSKYYQDLYGKKVVKKKAVTKTATKTSDTSDTKIEPNKWSGTLQRGSSGNDVSELQQLLKNLGYDVGDSGADGKFGLETRAAVIRFQKANGLAPDGKVGPKTKAVLSQKKLAKYSILSECTSILRKGNTGKYVKEVQSLLTQLGFYTGSATGKFDSKTEIAVTNFQKVRKLQADGIVGPKTRAELLS